jgi:hypothetical protein
MTHVSRRANPSIPRSPLSRSRWLPTHRRLLCTAAASPPLRRVSGGRRLRNAEPPVLPAPTSSTQDSPAAPRGGRLCRRRGARGGRDSAASRADHRGPQPGLTGGWFPTLEASWGAACGALRGEFLAAASRSAASFPQGVCFVSAARIYALSKIIMQIRKKHSAFVCGTWLMVVDRLKCGQNLSSWIVGLMLNLFKLTENPNELKCSTMLQFVKSSKMCPALIAMVGLNCKNFFGDLKYYYY